MAALTITLKLKTSGKGPGIIAREMALDIAQACYAPFVSEHVPGPNNDICDALSRKFQPGIVFQLPAAVKDVPETLLCPRTRCYYRTAELPTSLVK